jgi:hypothetical protein
MVVGCRTGYKGGKAGNQALNRSFTSLRFQPRKPILSMRQRIEFGIVDSPGRSRKSYMFFLKGSSNFMQRFGSCENSAPVSGVFMKSL